MRSVVLALSLALLGAGAASAQVGGAAGPGELVDRVVAVVGDTSLLLSDVESAVAQLEAQSGQRFTPEQREATRREILQARVDELMILEAAKQAGITADEAAIVEQVDTRINELMNQLGGEAALEAALRQEGLTRPRYRELISSQARVEQIREQYIGQVARSRALPVVDEAQIRQAFEARSASLGQAPIRLSLQQVVVKSEPSDSAREKALAEARQVYEELRAGGDFQVLARRFSDDEGTKEAGGDLGWFRPGRMVAEFESAAFALRPGQTSGIVSTDFGFHIIHLERVRGAERKARHILISPEVTPADIERARQRADSVATAIRGGASPTLLARAYGTASSEAEVSRIPLEQLPPTYQTPLRTAAAGEVVGPLELAAGRAPNFAVVKVSSRQEAGPYTLEDVRERVVQLLQQQQLAQDLVSELRSRIHVDLLY